MTGLKLQKKSKNNNKNKALKNDNNVQSSLNDSYFEIRGELCCLKDKFEIIKQKMLKLGLDLPSSQRNIVAGLISRKDHDDLCQYLDFFAFDVISYDLYDHKQALHKQFNHFYQSLDNYTKHYHYNNKLFTNFNDSFCQLLSSFNIFPTEQDKTSYLKSQKFQTAANDYDVRSLSLLSKPKIFEIEVVPQIQLHYYNGKLEDLLISNNNPFFHVHLNKNNLSHTIKNFFVEELSNYKEDTKRNIEDLTDQKIVVYGELVVKQNLKSYSKNQLYNFCHLLSQSADLNKRSDHKNLDIIDNIDNQLSKLINYIECCCYDLEQKNHPNAFDNHQDKVQWFSNHGFNLSRTFTEITEFLNKAYNYSSNENSQLAIDGVVFTYNDNFVHDLCGSTSHHPKYRLCFKWKGQKARSSIEKITWDVSRLGFVTPVASIKPIEIGEATIKRVTLHNVNYFLSMNPWVDDYVDVIRSGDIIPRITKLITNPKNHKNQADIFDKIPSKCPACGHQLSFIYQSSTISFDQLITKALTSFDDISALICKNTDGCLPQIVGKIDHWCQSVGINDLSEKRLEMLVKFKLVNNISDLYKLNHSMIETLPRMGEKIANKIIDGIENSKNNIQLDSFLVGLGITGLQLSTAEKIISVHNSLSKILTITVDDLNNIDGIGEKSAQIIFDQLNKYQPMIEQLIDYGLVID